MIDILRCEVGSTAHGTGLPGHEDLDEMAITVPPVEYVLGLKSFEQEVIRTDTVTGRSLGPNERSTPDTYELTRYSLHKWMRLAVQGNPSILMMLFAPVREATAQGDELRHEVADKILSKRCLPRYAGYMRSQALRLVGEKGSGHGRRGGGKREDSAGYDTKFAMHMLRLGFQGIELAETGRIEEPIPDPVGEYLRSVRRGEVPFESAFQRAIQLHGDLERLMDPDVSCALRPEPDRAAVNEFMADTYLWTWWRR